MLLAEYEAIGNKTETGTPTKYHYEKRTDKGVLYLNRIPSDTTDTIQLVYRQPLEVIGDSAKEIDIEEYLYSYLIWKGAIDMWSEFHEGDPPSHFGNNAKEALAIAQTFHPEEVDKYFQPGRD